MKNPEGLRKVRRELAAARKRRENGHTVRARHIRRAQAKSTGLGRVWLD